jgi:hypothetical protein
MDCIRFFVGSPDTYRFCSNCQRFAKVVIAVDGERRYLCFSCSNELPGKDPNVVMRAVCSYVSCSNTPKFLVNGMDFGEGHLYLCTEHLERVDFPAEHIVALPNYD